MVVIVWEKIVDSTSIIWRQLTILGIRNIKEVERYPKRTDATFSKRKRRELGYRIEGLKYCDKPKSEIRNLYLSLDIDHLGILMINCAKFTLQVIDSRDVEVKT
ncbi:hypothetical protein BXP70_09350 [Hymenobacter crusticola]|uniref:Uncharacterized protein n=1 Tax=Hymenobacter crusticola TaxID=1770526 RepID=A0A243WGR1_9BACT|nr:hypothetical protein BXP70_09350 [Hymenobacter crusticola]